MKHDEIMTHGRFSNYLWLCERWNKIPSFWRISHHWLHQKWSFWQLLMKNFVKMTFSVSVRYHPLTKSQTVEQAVELPVIWDAMSSMWRHCHVHYNNVFFCLFFLRNSHDDQFLPSLLNPLHQRTAKDQHTTYKHHRATQLERTTEAPAGIFDKT